MSIRDLFKIPGLSRDRTPYRPPAPPPEPRKFPNAYKSPTPFSDLLDQKAVEAVQDERSRKALEAMLKRNRPVPDTSGIRGGSDDPQYEK